MINGDKFASDLGIDLTLMQTSINQVKCESDIGVDLTKNQS